MSTIAGLRMKNPAHPGGFVKSEIIDIAYAFGVLHHLPDALAKKSNRWRDAAVAARGGGSRRSTRH